MLWATLLAVALHATPPLIASGPPASTQPVATTAFLTVDEAAKEAREWIGGPYERTAIEGFAPAAEIHARVYRDPRPLRVWIARIDMAHPQVRVVVTAPAEFSGAERRFETRSATTLEFARQAGVQLAINTSAFGPMRERSGEPMDVIGLAAVEGRVYSRPHRTYGAMFLARDRQVTLRGPPLETEDVWTVVPGFHMLLEAGRIVVREEEHNSAFGGWNPRTAVGTDREGRTLWIVVVDGRQPGVSHGVTVVELACLFESLGAHDALNLDGGGSTTFVLQDRAGHHHVINTPVGRRLPGTLRQVANNLGLMLPGEGAELAGEKSETGE